MAVKTNLYLLTLFVLLCLLLSCGPLSAPAPVSTVDSSKFLRMKVNGKDWIADSGISCAVHPDGYNKAILIAGSKTEDGGEDFNIHLFNMQLGPSITAATDGNPNNTTIQLGTHDSTKYIYGSLMGFDMQIQIVRVSKNPLLLEVSFEGEMTGNAGDKLKITDGYFYYKE